MSNDLKQQLHLLEAELERMNKLSESGVMNEDGTAELVKNQLKEQIASIREALRSEGN